MKSYRIAGVIGWDTEPGPLAEFLKESGGEDVELTISSPGGLIGDALDMFNLLRNYDGNITARLSGYTMSAASYIAMAADKVVAEDNAVWMIHNAQGITMGDHNEMAKYSGILKGLSSMLGSAYAKFTGKSREEIASMMDDETWLFGAEIVDGGFAHEMLETDADKEEKEAVTAQARLSFDGMLSQISEDKKRFANDLSRAATALGAHGEKPHKQQPARNIMDMKMLREKHPDLVAAIQQEATAEMEGKLAEAKAEGATAERTRQADIRAQLIAGHEAVIEALIADGQSTGDDAARAMVQAMRKEKANTLANFRADAPPVVPAVSNDAGLPDNTPPEVKAKKEWDASKALQAEFVGDFDLYLAYLKDDAGVKIKTLKNRGE